VDAHPFWRGTKCEALAYWNGLGDPGPCPKGKTHDHSENRFYIPPNFDLDVTQVVKNNLDVGESWSDSSNGVRFEVLAMHANSATVRVTAT